MFALDPKNAALDLKGQLVGLAIGPPASVIEAIKAAFLIAIVDFIARHPGDPELPAQGGHLLPFQQSGYEF